LEGLIKDLWSI